MLNRIHSLSRDLLSILNLFYKSLLEVRQIRQRLANTAIREGQAKGVVVINAARSWAISDVELYLGYLLAKSGMQVYVLFDDGVLEHWDGAQSHKIRYYSPYRARWCIRIKHDIRKRIIGKSFSHKNLKRINYSDIRKKQPLPKTVLDSDKAYALSSTKRYFQEGFVDIEEAHKEYYDMSLRNCFISRMVAEYALRELKPDLYITSHGIYSVWGPAYQTMKQAGIPVAVWHVPGITTNKIRIVDRQNQVLAETCDWRRYDEKVSDSQLILEEGAKLLDSRMYHRTQDTMEYFGSIKYNGSVKGGTVFSRGMRFGMFPNVAWDGDVPERNIMFENVVDWCEYSVDAMRGSKNHLFIRFHPAEVTRLKGSIKLEDIIRKRIPDIDAMDNITLIPSSEPVDTYQFARQNIDVGLIYDGHLCLELTHMGIPVIACTNGNFTPDTIVYKPSTEDEYREWLKNPSVILELFLKDSDKRRSKAHKFAYWEFKDSLFEFTPLEKPYPAKINYRSIDKNQPISTDEQRILDRLLASIHTVQ